MTRPDLTDDAKIAAYRAELRAVGRNQRLAGFVLVLAGAAAVWAAGYVGAAGPALQWLGYAALALGWALMLTAIFLRTRFHRRRMREEG
jgi:fatty acid desaturase